MPFRGIPYWAMSKEVKKRTQRKIAKGRMAEKNWMWRGDNVGYHSLHLWVRSRKPKPALCEECQTRPPIDLTNISQEYRRDLDDWRWLCRSCHMNLDGRIKNLKQSGETKDNE